MTTCKNCGRAIEGFNGRWVDRENPAGPPIGRCGKVHAPAEPSSAPVETQACQHNSVREGTHKEDGYLVICNDCGADLSPTPGSHRNWKTIRHASEAKTSAQASESELPSIPKPLTKSKHWDDGIEWRIAGERAARLEREDQLRAALATVARLEQEVARLRDSHGKLLTTLKDLVFYSNGLVEEKYLRDAREVAVAAEGLAAPSETGGKN